MVLLKDAENPLDGASEQPESLKKTTLIFRTRKIHLKCIGHVIRKEGLEIVTLLGDIKGERDRRKQRATYLTSFCESMAAKGETSA